MTAKEQILRSLHKLFLSHQLKHLSGPLCLLFIGETLLLDPETLSLPPFPIIVMSRLGLRWIQHYGRATINPVVFPFSSKTLNGRTHRRSVATERRRSGALQSVACTCWFGFHPVLTQAKAVYSSSPALYRPSCTSKPVSRRTRLHMSRENTPMVQ